MTDDAAEEWTTLGYGTAIQAVGLPTRVTLRGMEVPWWAGTLVHVLCGPEPGSGVAPLDAHQMEAVLRRVQHLPHRRRLVTVAQLGGWAALAPMLDDGTGDPL